MMPKTHVFEVVYALVLDVEAVDKDAATEYAHKCTETLTFGCGNGVKRAAIAHMKTCEPVAGQEVE
jgi:hypothetical protein